MKKSELIDTIGYHANLTKADAGHAPEDCILGASA